MDHDLVELTFLVSLLVQLAAATAVGPATHRVVAKSILPCQWTTVDANVSLHRSEVLSVQSDLSLCNCSQTDINVSEFVFGSETRICVPAI